MQVQGSNLEFNKVFTAGVRSFACRCDREPITCSPQDAWEVDKCIFFTSNSTDIIFVIHNQTVLVCDNSDGKRTNADCTYTVTTGATYSEEHSFSTSIDTSIEMSYKEKINELFASEEVSGSVSLKTGFKWSSASTSTFTSQKTTTITDTAPRGTYI